MAQYSINAVNRKVSYTGSAGVGPYAFAFEILDENDVAVYKNQTLLTLTTDYTVTINANGTGSVTLTSAATASDSIVILGARDIERTTDFVTAGDLRASSLNEQLDALTIMVQQVAEEVERSVKAPAFDPTGINMILPKKADRVNAFVAFDANGDVSAAVPSDDVTTLAEVATDIATLADIEDGTVATNTIQTVSGISSDVTTVAGISADVTIVAADQADIGTVATDLAGSDNIGTVAGSIANVDATGSNIASVNTVAGELGASQDVTVVAADLSGTDTIGIVAGSIADVNTVAGEIGVGQDVTVVAANIADVGTVATDIANVNTTATNIANVNTTASISADVTAVANIDTDVTTVSGISANVTTVATNDTDVTTVASNIADVNTVAGDINNVNQVSANIADVNNYADTYLGGKPSDPTTRNNGSPLQVGDLYFNTAANQIRAYDGTNWTVTAPATSASLVDYTANGAGAVTTTVKDKLNESVSVKDFGAVGDGVTDDKAAIQAALDAAVEVHFPEADYFISGHVKTNLNQIVYGNNATLVVNGDYLACQLSRDCHVMNLNARQDSGSTEGTGFLVSAGIDPFTGNDNGNVQAAQTQNIEAVGFEKGLHLLVNTETVRGIAYSNFHVRRLFNCKNNFYIEPIGNGIPFINANYFDCALVLNSSVITGGAVCKISGSGPVNAAVFRGGVYEKIDQLLTGNLNSSKVGISFDAYIENVGFEDLSNVSNEVFVQNRRNQHDISAEAFSGNRYFTTVDSGRSEKQAGDWSLLKTHTFDDGNRPGLSYSSDLGGNKRFKIHDDNFTIEESGEQYQHRVIGYSQTGGSNQIAIGSEDETDFCTIEIMASADRVDENPYYFKGVYASQRDETGAQLVELERTGFSLGDISLVGDGGLPEVFSVNIDGPANRFYRYKIFIKGKVNFA